MGRKLDIFFHPGRTADELERLEDEARDNVDRIETLSREMRQQKEENSQLEAKLKDAEERRGKLEDCVNELAAELLHTRQELDKSRKDAAEMASELKEKSETEELIAGFEKALEGAEAMKERYEQRIARLRSEIINLRGRQTMPPAAGSDLEVIDMTTGKVSKENSHEAPDSDWLEPLE